MSTTYVNYHCKCNGVSKCGGYCEECQLDMQVLESCGCEKAAIYDLLRADMVGGPAQVLTKYHERDFSLTRSHVY